MKLHFSILLSLCLMTPSLFAQQQFPHAEELGDVHWHRDIDTAIQQAQTENKPIFILFQEVPGCATCRNYGQHVMTHPLIVEAIEDLFIPLAIFNNKGEKDAEVLRYFREPTWNNPVVRIIDHKKQNLTSRVSGNYARSAVVEAMIAALVSYGEDIPSYLKLLQAEFAAEEFGTKKATFSMSCFWTGEKKLGQIDGVVTSAPGFMGGSEVVTLSYNPDIISDEQLAQEAQKVNCSVYKTEKGFRPDREPKYYLSKTIYRHIPMTSMQATQVNSLIGNQKTPDHLLSNRQLNLLAQVRKSPSKKWPNAIHQDISLSWQNMMKIRE